MLCCAPLTEGRAMPDADTRPTSCTPERRLAQLADGFLATQLLYVAAELRLAEALADQPGTAAELADLVGADPGVLRRVLRGLAAEEVLDELPDGRFALAPAGHLLREGVPGSLRGPVLARGGLYYAALTGLLRSALDGGTPFELAHGMPFFAYLDAHLEWSATFQASMAARSSREAAAVVETYDFRPFQTIVDVGGGTGVLLGAVLAAAPELSGVLFVRWRSCVPAAAPCRRGEGCCSWRPCCPIARRTSPRRCGWTCTC
jgi:hypothetical protein